METILKWIKNNWKPLAVGAAVGFILGCLL